MFEKLTKFLPALDTEGLGEWVVGENGAPQVEYWEVVVRFFDAVRDLNESPGEIPARAKELIGALAGAAEREESCPGVLLGYLENGTVVEWLRELARLDEKPEG